MQGYRNSMCTRRCDDHGEILPCAKCDEAYIKDFIHVIKNKKERNYIVNDETYPTEIKFDNGTVVKINCENGRVYLGVERNG